MSANLDCEIKEVISTVNDKAEISLFLWWLSCPFDTSRYLPVCNGFLADMDENASDEQKF